MRPTLALAPLLLLFAQGKTTQDGVYTQAQATRGEATYGTACASCHGPDLAGDGQTPPLGGKEFNAGWNETALSDLFDRIHTTMPADSPGSLKPADVADVIAFILSKNHSPAGQAELPANAEALKQIKYAPPKP